ncbi:MAG: response regulator [Deltaproteobacteria bacterium]|nr:response regulator [Deltaproteobacteria bacterium]
MSSEFTENEERASDRVTTEFITSFQTNFFSSLIGSEPCIKSVCQFKSFLDTAPLSTAVVHADGSFAYANPFFCRLFTFEQMDIATGHIESTIVDDYRTKLLDILLALAKGKNQFFEIKVPALSKTNKVFWANFSLFVLPHQATKPDFIAIFVTPLSEENEIGQTLGTINNKILDFIKTSPLAIIAAGLDGMITIWNPAAEKLFGYEAAEVVGQIAPSITADKLQEARSLLDRLMAGESLTGFEARRRKKDGSFVDISIWGFPLYDGKGNVSSVVLTAFDITAKKNIELHLREAKEQAELANKAKNMFLAGISHEIRTPLAAIYGSSDMMESELAEAGCSDELRHYVTIIQNNSRHLLSLIDDLLDLTKMEANQLEIKRTTFSPLSEIELAVESVRPHADKKKTILLIENQDIFRTNVSSDPIRYRQILLNLLTNAIKFTSNGTITISGRRTDETAPGYMLHTQVQDTGIGIAEEQQALIFNPFTQANSSIGRKYGGVGLGLTLSRRLARALGGDLVLARSTPQLGSLFMFSVQVGHPAAGNKNSSGPLNTFSLNTNRNLLEGIRVLVVDDCLDLRILCSRALQKFGAEVDQAVNGLEALKFTELKQYDVILMDVQMPEMDGLDATSRLRQMGYSKPIVALTAHAMQSERSLCLQSGCDDYLSKPVSISTLIQTVYKFKN